MTRINVGVAPANLPRQLLLAEHREIVRIPNLVSSGRAIIASIPSVFCLGKGHVKFFYNKRHYLLRRYRMLTDECIRRGYNVSHYDLGDVPDTETYTPTQEAFDLVKTRILSKGFFLSQEKVENV